MYNLPSRKLTYMLPLQSQPTDVTLVLCCVERHCTCSAGYVAICPPFLSFVLHGVLHTPLFYRLPGSLVRIVLGHAVYSSHECLICIHLRIMRSAVVTILLLSREVLVVLTSLHSLLVAGDLLDLFPDDRFWLGYWPPPVLAVTAAGVKPVRIERFTVFLLE